MTEKQKAWQHKFLDDKISKAEKALEKLKEEFETKRINIYNTLQILDLEKRKRAYGTEYKEHTDDRGREIGVIYWKQDFVDEESGVVITVERTEMLCIDGIPVDKKGKSLLKKQKNHS